MYGTFANQFISMQGSTGMYVPDILKVVGLYAVVIDLVHVHVVK